MRGEIRGRGWLTGRSAAFACLAVASLAPNLGCFPDACDGHDSYTNEHWCDNDRVVACYWESSGNRVQVEDQCMPGGCYKDPKTQYLGCRVPDYTCPAGVTGYQCLGERRIDCAANGVAWDHDDCSQYKSLYAQPRHCVPNPGGAILACGYTNEPCPTPGEVRCLETGTVICRDSVWQGFVPSRSIGQSVCDASSIRYDAYQCSRVDYAWCEADQVRRCERCFDADNDQGGYERLCVGHTTIAQCEPGACVSLYDGEAFPHWLTGCSQPAAECSVAGQSVCIDNRPGYCVAAGVVALDRPCPEIFDATPTCRVNPGLDAGVRAVECH